MKNEGRRTLLMREEDTLISEWWRDFRSGIRTVEVYVCPQCGKYEFYRPANTEEMEPVEQAMKNFSHYSDEELKAVLVDPDYPPEVKEAARRLLER